MVTLPTSGYCDDNNSINGDGCNSTCKVESGWNCTLGDMSTPSSCIDKCGDGKIITSNVASNY